MTGDRLPTPPVPADCDLRGMEWMPVYGGRLFSSDFDAMATDAEFRSGVNLWWASWNQVPASSLPESDAALCKLAGLGKDLKAWGRVKDRAMHGFTLCGDGRYYHETLAAFALESWKRRLKDRERKAEYRRRQEERRATRTETGTERGRGQESSRDGTADAMRRDETGRDATRQDGTLEEEGSSSASAREPDPIDQAFAVWTEIAAHEGWPEVMFLNSVRRWRLAERLRECGGLEGWRAALDAARNAGFLKGPDGRFHRWFDLDWLLDEQKFTRLLEGRYAQRHRKAEQPSGLDAALAELGRAGSG